MGIDLGFLGFTEMDAEWKRMLRQRSDVHEDAKDFFGGVVSFGRVSGFGWEGLRSLEKLSSD